MILCCGEALIDMLPTSSPDGKTTFLPLPGGSVFNTSIALGRLGVPVGFFSGLSNDLFGTSIQAALRESNVNLSCAKISNRPTTLAFLELVDGQAEYFFYDENTAGRMLTEADLPSLPENIKTLLFGGISLVSEPCGSAYESLMRREAANRVTLLDPNIRPSFIQVPDAHRARLRRMSAMADIVKLSAEDLAWMEPAQTQAQAVASLLSAGTKLVVLTKGAQGAQAYWHGGNTKTAAVPIQIVDTVGAGDTFNAGLLATLSDQTALNKHSLANPQPEIIYKALAFAAYAAAITVSRAGANPPWHHEF